MGRLPKGFKKALQHHKDGPEEADAVAPETKPVHNAEHKAKHEAHPVGAPKPAAHAAHSPAGSEDEDGDDGPETKGKMLQRHKREMLAFKKNLQRMGKKSKDEVSKLTAEIEQRHDKELHELETGATKAHHATTAASTSARHASGVEGVEAGVMYLKVVDEGEEGHGQKTKAMKRREKLAAAEMEREARVAAELAAAGPSARQQEEEALQALLEPLGLAIRDIRADGHCLYRSIEDQLTLIGDSAATTPATDYLGLRKAAAAHMRAHPKEYVHFLSEDDTAGHASPESALEAYCDALESTAVWGGQLELSVLAQVLQRAVRVYSVGLPPLTLGEEFPGSPLQVCYLRHAFGLGEHYNSLGPAGAGGAAAESANA